MKSLNDLLNDPVFQLNAILWMAQPLPDDYPIKPVLSRSGFEVYSISPMLAPPPDLLLQIKQTTLQCQERIRPDLVLKRLKDRRFVLLECKARSFGTSSTTANQARLLLIICGPRFHDSLGLPGSEIGSKASAFLVSEDDLKSMDATCAELKKEITSSNLLVGENHNIALGAGNSEIVLVADEKSREFFDLPALRNPVVEVQEGVDPRPLYLVPYDPDCDQTEEERAYCVRVLFERIHAYILGMAVRKRRRRTAVMQGSVAGECTCTTT